MERLTSKRSGFSLVELLVAIIVLGILTGIVLQSGSAAQKKARATSAMTVLEDYENAFGTVMLEKPGIMMDRLEAWQEQDASGSVVLKDYTTKEAMSRLVREMNVYLEPTSQLLWDDELHVYRSQGIDPWGGYYIMVEYPYSSTNLDGYDPTTGKGISAMRCSFWAMGIDETIYYGEPGNTAQDGLVTDSCIGLAMEYQGGYVHEHYHGGESDSTPFTDYRVARPN